MGDWLQQFLVATGCTLPLLTACFLVAGCGVFGIGNDEDDEILFRDVDHVSFLFDQMEEGSIEDRLRLEAKTIENGDSLVVHDTLRLVAGSRYLVSLEASSEDAQAYLSTAGPPAALLYGRSAPLDAVLIFEPVSLSVRPLTTNRAKGAPLESSVFRAGLSAKQSSAGEVIPRISDAPEDIFRFELATADTSISGPLRLRLERYREPGENEPDHVDFDVVVPVRLTEISKLTPGAD